MSGCKDGPPAGLGFQWRGPGCRIGNIAYGKPTNQTGIYQGYDSSRAVDGNVNPDFSAGFCAHMLSPNNKQSQWVVDLQNLHVIFNVTLFNRIKASETNG